MSQDRILPIVFLILSLNSSKIFAQNEKYDLQFSENWTNDEQVALTSIWKRMPIRVRNLAPVTITKDRHFIEKIIMRINFLENGHTTVEIPSESIQKKGLEKLFIQSLFRELDRKYGYSENEEWRKISGWAQKSPLEDYLPSWFDRAENQDQRGYASIEGLESPREDFASFAHLYFASTPKSTGENSIKCRAPRKYEFFRHYFGERPSSFVRRMGVCQSISKGFLSDIEFIHPLTQQTLDLGPIDSGSVSGFEILYATPGVGEMAEVAGHLLLRIKLKNNPFAEKSGIENPYDLVVSFLADTEKQEATAKPTQPKCKDSGGFFDLRETSPDFDPLASTLQALKGLSGGFLTTFDRSTLYATVYNYTVIQDRNLLRFELQLSDQQKKDLLERLFIAKKNYKSKYFFFDRNCASILVKIIAEGIGDNEIQKFDPVVSPPNTLIAYMRRRSLIKPVFPSFYGYRKEAQIAQNMVRKELTALQNLKIHKFNDLEDLFSKNQKLRLKVTRQLFDLGKSNEEATNHLVVIARLLQVSEKLYLERDDLCQPFTSEVIAETRNFLLSSGNNVPTQRLDHSIQMAHIPMESEVIETGSHHTKHYSIQMGYRNKEPGDSTFLGLALHRQIMGDYSSHAMQRTSEVVLGQFEGEIGGSSIHSSKFTLLKIRKFKDELDRAPTIFQTSRTFGIGLGLLNYRRNHGTTEMNWATGELLFSLYSGSMNDRHLYFATGLNLKTMDHEGERKEGIGLNLSINGLWTLDSKRLWQLRSFLIYENTKLKHDQIHRYEGRISLSHRLQESTDNELLVFTEYGRTSQESDEFQIGIEINNW